MSFSAYSHPAFDHSRGVGRTFTFREGARVKGGVDAQTVGEELERIAAETGGVTPQAVVESAKPADAPLHPCFTWDDEKAADLYRQGEARTLVRSVEIIVTPTEAPVPAFVSVERVDEAGARKSFSHYVPVSDAVEAVDLFDGAVASAQARIDSALKSLQDLERAGRVCRADRADRLERIRNAIEGVTAAQQALA